MAPADPNNSPGSGASSQNNVPEGSAPEHSPPETATEASERFSLPSTSRSPVLSRQPHKARRAEVAPTDSVATLPLATPSATRSVGAGDGAQVLEREARARLLALRRIEWVALAIVGVLLGGAAWSWRARSDAIEGQRAAFNSSPNFRQRRDARPGAPSGAPQVPNEAPRPAQEKDRKAASQAIQSQLDAFKRDDFTAAIALQSQNLRRNFSSPENFRRMILENYPAFANFQSVRFGRALSVRDGSPLLIEVTLLGRESQTKAMYTMVREDGGYRVDSVVPTSGARPEPEDDAPPAPPADAI